MSKILTKWQARNVDASSRHICANQEFLLFVFKHFQIVLSL